MIDAYAEHCVSYGPNPNVASTCDNMHSHCIPCENAYKHMLQVRDTWHIYDQTVLGCSRSSSEHEPSIITSMTWVTLTRLEHKSICNKITGVNGMNIWRHRFAGDMAGRPLLLREQHLFRIVRVDAFLKPGQLSLHTQGVKRVGVMWLKMRRKC